MEFILDWMESWAFLIPLFVLLKQKNTARYFRPVIIYLWAGLVINLLINGITDLQVPLHFPHWLQSNNFLYNIHSVARLLLFSIFFIQLKQPFLLLIKKIIPVLFIIFVIVNFSLYEDFFYFDLISNRLLSVESAILLFYCLQYYFYIFLKEDQWSLKKNPSFWIVTGLSIFIVISFPIYLFYRQIIYENINFGVNIWLIQKMAFLFFCILTAVGFSKSKA